MINFYFQQIWDDMVFKKILCSCQVSVRNDCINNFSKKYVISFCNYFSEFEYFRKFEKNEIKNLTNVDKFFWDRPRIKMKKHYLLVTNVIKNQYLFILQLQTNCTPIIFIILILGFQFLLFVQYNLARFYWFNL